MNRFQVLFSLCTIAVSLYAIPAQAGGNNFNNFNNQHFKKHGSHQQFGGQFFGSPAGFPGRNFTGGNFNGRNFNTQQFNSFNFVPKHKQVNPFFFPTFQNQSFNNGHNFFPPNNFNFNKKHHNFNHFAH